MRKMIRRLLPVLTTLVISFALAACGGEPQADAEAAGEGSLALQTDEPTSAEGRLERAGADGERREERDRGERREERDGDERRAERDGEERTERGDGEEHGEEGDGDEHGEEGDGDEHSEEGEESGVQIGRRDTWIATRNGARLILSFNAASNSFIGRVENTTNEMLCAMRVEVHLSTGTELGPTERTDVPYGGTVAVELPTGGEEFATWTAHPEMSPCGGR